MKSLKWEGIGTKNLFQHTSNTHTHTHTQRERERERGLLARSRLDDGELSRTTAPRRKETSRLNGSVKPPTLGQLLSRLEHYRDALVPF